MHLAHRYKSNHPPMLTTFLQLAPAVVPYLPCAINCRVPESGTITSRDIGQISSIGVATRVHRTQPTDSQPSGSFVSVSGGLAGSWQHLGPGNVGGRTRSLVINPGNPNIMWAAGVGGGIWKSTDGGANWTPKGDLLQNIAISTLIQDPRSPDVLYAGTGEGYFNIDAIRGAGIFKSIDGGETWNQLASTANSAFYYVQKFLPRRLQFRFCQPIFESRLVRQPDRS